VLAVGYITLKLALALSKGGLTVFLAFAGIALFFVTAVNDVLYLNRLPSLGGNLMPVGIAVLTLAYMIILSVEFAENERRIEAAKLNEEKMLAERNALEHLDRMKTEFFQDMRHDLKTPLTVISTDVLNAADQLDFEIDKDDMRQSLNNAQREIMRMSRMVDDAINFPSGHGILSRMKPIDIASLLHRVETYRSVLGQRGNVLTLDIPDALPEVNGNADMLLQVLLNLLSNANRHTQNGEIAVIASEGNGAVSVTVRDNGEGVKTELLSNLFTRGVSEGGTGFGLSICKSVIETHGGEISLKSEYGKGTAVTFTLPIYEKKGTSGTEDSGGAENERL
jgi:signal transduction histidine kinase